MAITVDWGNKTVHVPRADMVLVQTNPTEIRSLDINIFRGWLHAEQDTEDGMMFPDIFSHTPPLDVGGVTLARAVEIINEYTITFEDGQYAVSLTGGNTNILDRVNVNQVSVRSSNSAGLVTSTAIEFGEYGDKVTIDAINGEGGTVYPKGTLRSPVDNLEDAILIAASRGFRTIYTITDLTIGAGHDVSGLTLRGQTPVLTNITIESDAVCTDCTITECTVDGILDGGTNIINCIVGDISYVNGVIDDSGLTGTITLDGNADAVLRNCSSTDIENFPTINMNVSGQNCVFSDYSGKVAFKNLSGATTKIGVQIDGGTVVLDSTINGGEISVTGVGLLEDNSTSYTSLAVDGLLNRELISKDSWNIVHIDTVNGVSGTAFPLGTYQDPVDNLADAVTIAERRGITELEFNSDYTFDNTVSISNYRLIGESPQLTTLTFEEGCLALGCSLKSVTATGIITGVIGFQNCTISNLSSESPIAVDSTVIAKNCLLQGVIALPVLFGGKLHALDCWGIPLNGVPPIIDMNGGDFDIDLRNYSGFVSIRNCTATNADIRLMLNSGGVTLENTVDGGDFILTGSGTLTDNSTSTTSLSSESLINRELIGQSVWDESIANHLIAGTTGLSVGVSQFAGKVWLDTTSGTSGTIFPTGTARVPVDNLDDALTIATTYGLKEINVIGSLTVAALQNISGYTISSQDHATITLSSGCFNFYTTFKDVNLEGTSNGYSILQDCSISDNGLDNFYGTADRIILNGNITISSDNTKNAVFLDMYTGNVSGPPSIDCNGDGAKISIRGATGALKFINKTGSTQKVFIDSYSARFGFDSTITAGAFSLRGIGYIYQNDSTVATFDTEGFISQDSVATAVWDEPIVDHLLPDTMGHQMYHVSYGGIVHVDAISGTAGVTFPTGTTHQPCSNLVDALSIASTHFITGIHFTGSYTILDTDGDLTGITLGADRSLGNVLTITSMTNSGSCYFEDVTISGALTGGTRFTRCVIGDVTGFDGGAKDSLVTGDITITGTGANYFTNCDTYITDTSYKALDVGDKLLNLIRCRGSYEITNYTGTATVTADFVAGNVLLSSTCISGVIVISGLVHLEDETAAGCFVVDATITQNGVAEDVWNSDIADFLTNGTFGAELATKADISASTSTDIVTAESSTLNQGTTTSGDYTSTQSRDGVYWQVTEDAVNGLDIEFTFNVPSEEHRAQTFDVYGRYVGLPSSTHYIELWAYNYDASSWEKLSEEYMSGGMTSDQAYSETYYERHIDRDNSGEVKIKLLHNTTTYNNAHNIYLDFVSLSSVEVVTTDAIATAVTEKVVTDPATLTTNKFIALK